VNRLDINQPSRIEKLPVALFCFKRPHLTREVFNAIREYQPSALHVFLDAARSEVIGETDLVEDVKGIFSNSGEVFPIVYHFATVNLGIQNSFHQGLLAMSKAHEKFIVLEDDCLPNADFFDFMSDCLSYFASSSHVGMIQGLNLNSFTRTLKSRGYLSSRMKIWGWGTWSDSVVGFDPSAKPWLEEDPEKILKRAGWNFLERKRFISALNSIDSLGTWDYQWVYHLMRQEKYSLSPTGNFVVNLGFGEDSIHTVIPWPSARRGLLSDKKRHGLGSIQTRIHWLDGLEFHLRMTIDLIYALRHFSAVVRHIRNRSHKAGG
jgi:hypothetical protein